MKIKLNLKRFDKEFPNILKNALKNKKSIESSMMIDGRTLNQEIR